MSTIIRNSQLNDETIESLTAVDLVFVKPVLEEISFTKSALFIYLTCFFYEFLH
jgi:hypothetical protein